MKELINELNKYLDEKDSAMMHMNPLHEAQKKGGDTAYFRGIRHGACEVIGEITGIVNAFDNEEYESEEQSNDTGI